MQDAILGGRDKKRMKWEGCEWLLQVQAWSAWEIILERALEADRIPQFSRWGASCPVRLREPGSTCTVFWELEVPGTLPYSGEEFLSIVWFQPRWAKGPLDTTTLKDATHLQRKARHSSGASHSLPSLMCLYRKPCQRMQFKTNLATDLIKSLLLNNKITLTEGSHTKYRHMVNMLKGWVFRLGRKALRTVDLCVPSLLSSSLCPFSPKLGISWLIASGSVVSMEQKSPSAQCCPLD